MGLKKSRGSLTVEAAVILLFCLFVFLIFLSVIRLCYVQSALDQAVKDTGRDIASVSYPLALFHAYKEEILQEAESTDEYGEEERQATIFGDILQQLGGGEEESLSELYDGLVQQGGCILVESLLSRYLETYRLNPAHYTLLLVHLPQNSDVFAAEKNKADYQKAGFLPEVDFTKEDVVIQAEYTITLPLPLLAGNYCSVKSSVVERAWLRGGNGVYTLREEKGIFEQAGEERGKTVYVTKTGIRYHVSTCNYLRKSSIALPVSEAQSRGYTPCKVCLPGGEVSD